MELKTVRELFDDDLRVFISKEPDFKGFNFVTDNSKENKGAQFLESFDLPAKSGMSGFNGIHESGIYQINLHCKVNTQYDGDRLAQKLIEHFKVGRVVNGYILSPPASRSGGFKNAPYYTIPISIHYTRRKTI